MRKTLLLLYLSCLISCNDDKINCDQLQIKDAIEVSFDSLLQDIEIVDLQMESDGEYRHREIIL